MTFAMSPLPVTTYMEPDSLDYNTNSKRPLASDQDGLKQVQSPSRTVNANKTQRYHS